MRPTNRLIRASIAAALACALLAIACRGDEADPAYGTLRVPEDYGSIQAAVDAAAPGDLVLIASGVYRESVEVGTSDLTIRGLDRNSVVLDGEFEREHGIHVLADGVAIENMTARNYDGNGFYWSGVTGYRGSYLTAHNSGSYGIYALDSVRGQFDSSYASGAQDAGFYIGQCYPCDAAIIDVTAEFNGLGYSGTNAGGNLIVARSTFRHNRVGIMPNSGTYELCYPQRETTFVGNLVYSNGSLEAPSNSFVDRVFGNGIVISGGFNNRIDRNRIFNNPRSGVAIVTYPEQAPGDDIPPDSELTTPCAEARANPDATPSEIPKPLYWQPQGNRVLGNVFEDSGEADIVLGAIDADVSTLGNCFSENSFETSMPRAIEQLAPCGFAGSGDWTDGELDLHAWLSVAAPPSIEYRDAPAPPDQPNMPDAATAPPRPARDVPMAIDVDSITVPARP